MNRRRLLVGSLFVGLLVVGGWWWGGRSEPVRNAPPARGAIVALGDSLTAAGSAGKGQAYVNLLMRRFQVPIVNSGVAGDTVADAYKRLDRDVLAYRPTVVIVLLGGNDMLRQMDLDQSFELLAEMIRRIQDAGAMVVLVGLKGRMPYLGVGARYKRLARRTGSVLVPNIMDDIFGHRDRMADPIHPNAKGHQIMAKRIGNALAPYLEHW